MDGMKRRPTTARWYRGGFLINRTIDRYVEDALARLVGPGSVVVDVGCGAQPFRPAVERRGGRYVGIDRTLSVRRGATVAADAVALALVDDAADVVLCTELLEHTPDLDGVAREVVRVLRAGGALVVTTPFMFGLHEEPWDFHRLTPHGVRALAARHGLQPTEIVHLGGELEVMATAWEAYWNRRITDRRSHSKAALLLLRTVGNLPGPLASAAADRRRTHRRPPKVFLTTGAVLTKAEAITTP